MSTLPLVLGILLLLFTLVDLVWTTLTLRGAGPISRLLARCIWGFFRFWHTRLRPCHLGLAQSGWILLVMTAIAWVALTWTGWVLIFGSDPTAIVNDRTREPADLPALIYFSGFAVYTLGVGDYVPNGAPWQVLTPVATAHGFILITLSVTYFIQVLSAAVGDRTAALFIHSLGGSPGRILQTSWNGQDFSNLANALSKASQMLAEHSQQHRAYPVLHYFHQQDKRVSLLLQTAILGEVLARIELLRGSDHGINPVALGGVLVSIDAVFEGLPAPLRRYPSDHPPLPTEEDLAAPGLPAPSAEEATKWRKQTAERRRRLRATALGDCWHWFDVESGAF